MRLTEMGRGWLALPLSARQVEATGIACDSRSVRPGDVFVAVRGETLDGHRFIPDAVRAGAVAVVLEEAAGKLPDSVPCIAVPDSRVALGRLCAAFYRHPSRDVTLVGVTGTKGKTTTAWLLAQLLELAGHTTGLFGTVLNRIGEEVLPACCTTPGPLEMEAHLRKLADLAALARPASARSGQVQGKRSVDSRQSTVDSGCVDRRALTVDGGRTGVVSSSSRGARDGRGNAYAVMEVSSHSIVQNRIAGLEFRAGIFTNLAPEHLDYHGSLARYLEAKAAFFAGLSPEAVAVLPREEPAARIIARRTAARVVWYGLAPEDGLEGLRRTPEGLTFRFRGEEVATPLWGTHNLLNLLGALTAAEVLGLDRRAMARGAAELRLPPGRMEAVPGAAGVRVFVDYAHTDGSLEAALRCVREVTPGRVIVVFGCGGQRDRQKRPRMGRVAERFADRVVITSDNPRGEDPEAIIDEIAQGLERAFEAALVPDRREAINLAIIMAKPGDTVLIAGKGHETYQEARGKRIPFDDRVEARAALARRGLVGA